MNDKQEAFVYVAAIVLIVACVIAAIFLSGGWK